MTSRDRYRGVPALVLGAAGFVGRWVARSLSLQHADLSLAVRDEGTARRVLDPLGVRGTIAVCDLERPPDILSLIERVRPAVVFNLAGYGVDPDERLDSVAEAINSSLVRHVSDALASHDVPAWTGQRIVHVGSALEVRTHGWISL